MERKIENKLLEWKSDPYRKPLILQGARQVGKTYTTCHLERNIIDRAYTSILRITASLRRYLIVIWIRKELLWSYPQNLGRQY